MDITVPYHARLISRALEQQIILGNRLAGDNYFGRSRLLEWPPLPRRWRWREGGGGGSPKGDRSRPPPGSVHSTLLTFSSSCVRALAASAR